jgi:hypothetical protein
MQQRYLVSAGRYTGKVVRISFDPVRIQVPRLLFYPNEHARSSNRPFHLRRLPASTAEA